MYSVVHTSYLGQDGNQGIDQEILDGFSTLEEARDYIYEHGLHDGFNDYKIVATVLLEKCKREGLDMSVLDKHEYSAGDKFKHHELTEAGETIVELFRNTARYFAKKILTYVPDSRERSIALTKLEEALMWANKAVALRVKGGGECVGALRDLREGDICGYE